MKIDQETAITKLHLKLLKGLQVTDDFIDLAYSRGLIREYDVQEIHKKTTKTGKAREFLLCLVEQDREIYEDFLKVLVETNQAEVSEWLQEKLANIRQGKTSDPNAVVNANNNFDDFDYSEQTPGSSDVYLVSHILPGGYCGRVLLINNIEFTELGYDYRSGSKNDVEALKGLFNEIKFDVTVSENLTSGGILQNVKDFLQASIQIPAAQIPASNVRNTFVTMVCIMTHGRDGEVFGTDSRGVRIKDLIELMTASNCPQLAGMPKWLFIQACRGELREYATYLQTNLEAEEKIQSGEKFDVVTKGAKALRARKLAHDGDIPASKLKFPENSYDKQSLGAVPDNADILISYATCSSYVAWRWVDFGSIYVQRFVETLQGLSESRKGSRPLPRWKVYDVQTLLTLTNNRVGRIGKYDTAQTCEFHSRLSKLLFLPSQ